MFYTVHPKYAWESGWPSGPDNCLYLKERRGSHIFMADGKFAVWLQVCTEVRLPSSLQSGPWCSVCSLVTTLQRDNSLVPRKHLGCKIGKEACFSFKRAYRHFKEAKKVCTVISSVRNMLKEKGGWSFSLPAILPQDGPEPLHQWVMTPLGCISDILHIRCLH